ncbi:diguanylate cyclase (GGDEF) domain-containing protein [Desulfonatronum thiosulfatophilum]|uniref:Diguanylate cyclase (GGDEF) domain-containing protein n=1 Tax=Desulfonatronum thiosulfatophilum TaxID=617002 RepID=A0A1G6C8N6_9BACT|nr:GGDEF domain-containing protein [Desulfonatronum thiosulfatophilum]SDB29233.1 diguanylate cyclase (GGDEF) domain-containing protein [Desulfonatronum thiosulfatophilum]
MIFNTLDATETSMRLERQDLITFEPELRAAMSRFLPFSSYGLYFPASLPTDMLVADSQGGHQIFPVYHAQEKKALLPLHRHGELLGVFVARGVRGRVTKTMLHLWSCLCGQIMDNLLLHKKTRTDPLTGLANSICLEETLSREIRLVHRGLWPDTPISLEDGISEYSASVGLICLDVDGFSRINELWGYQFGDIVLRDLARVAVRVAPEQAICARLREDTLAICFSGATTTKCQELASALLREVGKMECENKINGEKIALSVSQGYVTYPQDFHGRQLRKSVREQTGLMLEKAARALHNAQEQGPGRIRAFSGILRESGVVLEILPMNRILVSLGRSVDAREGQRFLVWSSILDSENRALPEISTPSGRKGMSRVCKAEVQLVEVRGDTSVAEIILLHDPGSSILPEDQLTILRTGSRNEAGEDVEDQAFRDAVLELQLMTSREFIKQWVDLRQQYGRFSLILLHLEGVSNETESVDHADVERKMLALATLASDKLGPRPVMGRFSFSTLACLIPEKSAADLHPSANDLIRTAGEVLLCPVYAGMADYPFLAYSKADILDNCRKALEHAMMLPEPSAVEFCSTSLTVSADRYFSSGDIYSALEEYKTALLADELNHLARNSLGVCYARLGKYPEALAQFTAILNQNPKDIMASYNQGHTFLKLGEQDRARQAFLRCLELDTKHVFSLIRLGQLAEQDESLDAAREYFEQAKTMPGGEGLTHRHLARLDLRQGDLEGAREHLHQALVHNSRDALAMHLLAKMYLEQGEDPEIAETLARQSVALWPEQRSFWEVLARALEGQGRDDEARLARERSG